MRINSYFRFENCFIEFHCPSKLKRAANLVYVKHDFVSLDKDILINYPMADDSNFVALLTSLLSIDNDARTAAEVSVAIIKLEKSIKLQIARKMCFAV